MPITVPEDNRLSRPSREGSMVPELLSVVPLPVSDMVVPPRPNNTPREPPGSCAWRHRSRRCCPSPD